MKFERLPRTDEMPERSRSRELRRGVALPANIVAGNGEITTVDVLDLSYDGCRISTPIELAKGERVKLGILGLGSHDAQVKWYRDGEVGLAFAAVDAVERKFVPRGNERVELSAGIYLRRVGRAHYRARIFDLSNCGCRAEFVERPRPDELVWVKFDNYDAIEARVCWVDGFYGGLKFLRPIHPAVFELLLARLLADSA